VLFPRSSQPSPLPLIVDLDIVSLRRGHSVRRSLTVPRTPCFLSHARPAIDPRCSSLDVGVSCARPALPSPHHCRYLSTLGWNISRFRVHRAPHPRFSSGLPFSGRAPSHGTMPSHG
ncbi:unnamed protein product, partial [Ectocarpus sp. 13 AM-2016]